MFSKLSNVDSETIKANGIKLVYRIFPILTWWPKLTRAAMFDDAVGGFITGVIMVPTSLSWASFAQLPLSCGLSAAFYASLAYGTFGQCGVLTLGPVAEATTLLISIPGIPVQDREKTFQSIGVQVGILSMILSFIDGGKVIKTIFAKAVGDAYTSAAALLAICVQVKVMFNLTAPSATLLQDVIITTVKALSEQMTIYSIYSFFYFLAFTTYLIQIRKLGLPLWIPHQLVVVIASILITWYFRLDERWGLNIVRELPSALSLPHFPPWGDVIGFGPYTLTLTIVSFVQMYVIAQRVRTDVDPNTELFASGATNFVCNIFSGMPVTNSFGCSSVLLQQHVQSPLVSYSAATVVFITVAFLTRLGVFYYLPKQALAALVVSSFLRLLDFSTPVTLWRYSKKDAAVWIFTFVLTIFGGITIGVLSGIALSLVLVVLRIALPRAGRVGLNMATLQYGDIRKDPELLVYPNILLWRFEAPLYFVNIGYFRERLQQSIENEIRPIDVVIVSCGKIVDIDAAALAMLSPTLQLLERLDPEHPRRIILAETNGRLEQVLLESQILPMYTPEEYDDLSISEIEDKKKFPVVFRKLEEAIAFAQRIVAEIHGEVDVSPYPNVSFLTDIVVEAATTNLLKKVDLFLPTDSLHGSIIIPEHINVDWDGEEQQARLEKLRKLSSFDNERELIGVMGLIRHAELTPRQKKVIFFDHKELLESVFPYEEGSENILEVKQVKRTVEELYQFIAKVEELLSKRALKPEDKWRRLLSVLKSSPKGLEIYITPETSESNELFDYTIRKATSAHQDIKAATIEVKWGGVLTRSGITRAHRLGQKLFARFFAAGDLPLEQLIHFTQNVSAVSSDESRVINTAIVVMLALKQSRQFSKKDIHIDDDLMRGLSPITRRMLSEEYNYLEHLLHIDSVSAARHYFHIPGFRQLLRKDPNALPTQREQAEPPTREKENSSKNPKSRPKKASRNEIFNQQFSTPMVILEELKEKLSVLANIAIPARWANLHLSNQETVIELQQRYEALYRSFFSSENKESDEFPLKLVVRESDRESVQTMTVSPTGNQSISAMDFPTSKQSSAPRASPSKSNLSDADLSLENPFAATISPVRQKKYDLKDVTKLRDYASFDLLYNIPIIQEAAVASHEPELFEIIKALQRVAIITENMARVAENVLGGVNSSKRFIIGSLVCCRLVKRLLKDYQEIAKIDERRGIEELLVKAQGLYMKDNAGVEHDVRRVMKKSEEIIIKLAIQKDQRSGKRGESALLKELRLKFPFITLPKENNSTVPVDAPCTRLYFSSYLHVQGVSQCFFDSGTVEGFNRPSREDLEVAQSLYMKHLIFKIFRRRNISYTETELCNALRGLNLLFQSDVDYAMQQESLRDSLAAIYHSMYYVSMEVFLSMGDSDTGSIEIDETELLYTNSSPTEVVLNKNAQKEETRAFSSVEETMELPSAELATFDPIDQSQASLNAKPKKTPQAIPQENAGAFISTPQEGLRNAAKVNAMRKRLCTVTPMRRIHEGLSMEDFVRLVKEIEDAVNSQRNTYSSSNFTVKEKFGID